MSVNLGPLQFLLTGSSSAKPAPAGNRLEAKNFTHMLRGLLPGESKLRDMPGDMLAEVIDKADATQSQAAEARLSAGTPVETARAHASSDGRGLHSKTPHQQFEATLLRNFTEEMMPKKASSLYGEGTAGDIWRSLQVDLMSQKMAEAGGIGIAHMLDAHANGAHTSAAPAGLNEIGSIEPNAQTADALPLQLYGRNP